MKYKIKGYDTVLHLSLIFLEVKADNEKEAIKKAKKLATREYYQVIGVIDSQ